MTDLACSLLVVLAAAVAALAYAGRASRSGAWRHPRVESAGSSALLGRGLMHMGYWAIRPVGRACVALGVDKNAVSWASLALAAAAGVTLALGHLGVGALLGVSSSVCDALDGFIARETGTASEAGEVLDAAIDRYAELFFLAGVAIHFRADVFALSWTLAAGAGSVMVSYATAKAQAMGVEAPRGSMRREERAAYLGAGAALAPIAAAASARWGLPGWIESAPLLIALVLVAIVGNYSAARRLRAVARGLQKPGAPPLFGAHAPPRGKSHVATGDASH